MNKLLLLFALLTAATACQQERTIGPNTPTLAGEITGVYHTNVYLDPACVTLPASQLPYAEVQAKTDSTVTLVYTKFYPAKSSQRMSNVGLSRQADVIQLRLADSIIGTLQTDRLFMNNGMEKQGKLLRVSLWPASQQTLYFAGFR